MFKERCFMGNSTDMSFVISITGCGKHIIGIEIITITAFLIGIGAGVLIHYYLSKLPMSKLIIILIISFISGICYLLEVFGKLSSFMHYLQAFFT